MSRALDATSFVMTPPALTCAKSLTLLRSLLATLGVPLDLPDISSAPSGVISTPRIDADLVMMVFNSEDL